MRCDIINPVRNSAAGFESNVIAVQERNQILTKISPVKENTLYKCRGLIEMNKIKGNQEDSAEYLLDKLDNLLLDLEK